MSDHVYKLTEIVGTSRDGQDAAIKVALRRAEQVHPQHPLVRGGGAARLCRGRRAGVSGDAQDWLHSRRVTAAKGGQIPAYHA